MGKLIEPRILGFNPVDADTSALFVADKDNNEYKVFDSEGELYTPDGGVVSDRLDALEAGIPPIDDARIVVLENAKAQNDLDVADLQGRMTTAESDIDAVEATVAAEQLLLDQAQTDITNLQGDMTTAQADIVTAKGVADATTIVANAHVARTDNPHAVTHTQVGADAAGTAATAVSNHVAAADPHAQYLKENATASEVEVLPLNDANNYFSTGTLGEQMQEVGAHMASTANPHSVTFDHVATTATSGTVGDLPVADPDAWFTGSTIVTQLQEVGAHKNTSGNPHTTTAALTPISDAGSYYGDGFVEGALQEIGASLAKIAKLSLSRFVGKAISGQALKVSFLGDSILEGSTASVPGTTDCASLVCARLAERYGVGVTKYNNAVSGDRIYNAFVGATKLEKAITDASDLIVIGFGRNDLKSDISTPGTGYPLTGFVSCYEYAIRRIRRELPNCDIVILKENPAAVASSETNAAHVAQNVYLDALAVAYNVAIADGYTAFTDLGDWDSYLSDGSHPNDAGHLLLADTIMELFDNTNYGLSASIVRPMVSVPLYDKTKSFQRLAFVDTASEIAYANINTPRYAKTGTWVGSVTSTAASYVNCLFWGEECFVGIVCGAGTGIVDIYADQALIYDNLDLSAISDGVRYIPVTLSHAGVHSVTVECVSGSLDFRGFVCKKSNIVRIPITDARLTFNEYWGAVAQNTNAFLYDNRLSTNVAAQVEFDFYGTGIGTETKLLSVPTSGLTVTIDGVVCPDISFDGAVKSGLWGGKVLKSGLAFGKHHAVLKSLNDPIRLAGFFVLDGVSCP